MSDATLADLRRWNTDFPPVGDYRWAPATVDDLIAALIAEGAFEFTMQGRRAIALPLDWETDDDE